MLSQMIFPYNLGSTFRFKVFGLHIGIGLRVSTFNFQRFILNSINVNNPFKMNF
jgi:hypothetical protein